MFFGRTTTIVTHNGGFHADDIFAVAALTLFLDREHRRYRIRRTRDMSAIEAAEYVVDVGDMYDPVAGRFDHHQKGGAGVRDNGIPYAAFGLVWKEFGVKLSGDEAVAREIDRKFAQPIDANDNGMTIYASLIEKVSPVTFQDIVGTYYPGEDASDAEYDAAFMALMKLARDMLMQGIDKTRKQFEVNDYMASLYEAAPDKRVLVVDRKYSRFAVTAGALSLPEVLYIVYPSKRSDDEWNIVAARKDHETMETKKSFPAHWAGLRDAELAAASGVPTAKFCHNGRFLCVTETKEDAVMLANIAANS